MDCFFKYITKRKLPKNCNGTCECAVFEKEVNFRLFLFLFITLIIVVRAELERYTRNASLW